MTQAQVLEGTWEEIRPQAEAIARRHAGQRFKLILVGEEADNETAKPLSAKERIRILDELAEKNRNLPVLPPEAFERESLYDDRW